MVHELIPTFPKGTVVLVVDVVDVVVLVVVVVVVVVGGGATVVVVVLEVVVLVVEVVVVVVVVVEVVEVVVVGATVVVVVVVDEVVVVEVVVVDAEVSMVTLDASVFDVGPEFPAASETVFAVSRAITVPSLEHVTETVMLVPELALGVKAHPLAVPALLKSPEAIPLTDSLKASV